MYCTPVSRDESAIAGRDVRDSEAISDSRKRPVPISKMRKYR
jgi:hypothetical protein